MSHEQSYKDYEGKLPLKVLQEIEEAVPGSISKEKLAKVLEETLYSFTQAKVHAGECVGLVSAESIGEPGTQMTLDFPR